MDLRWYQEEAVQAVYQHLRQRNDNPCVVLPTGSGKTPLLAQICSDAVNKWHGRVLVLAHVKELLQQARDKLSHWMAWDQVGVYSAGLKSRDTAHPVIVAGIQSVYKRAHKLRAFDLIIVDEAHLIPTSGDGMYRRFLADAMIINPNVRVIGLTATPYRLDAGMICTATNILNAVCYEAGVKELIVQGYLCPLRSKRGATRADLSGVHMRGGEFIASEMADAMDPVVASAVAETMEYCHDRHSVLVFAASVAHAETIRSMLEEHGESADIVTGESSHEHRADTLERFRAGSLKYLVNVNVLTTGFDAPNVDAISLIRATASPGLYYQMVGRGLRMDPTKVDCLVLDFGENIITHGPIDDMQPPQKPGDGTGDAPVKECPECREMVHAGFSICPACEYVFPAPDPNHQGNASDAAVLSGEVITLEYPVKHVSYSVHVKRGREDDPDYPRTLRVNYAIGLADRVSEWICLEHPDGFARQKAKIWWEQRSQAAVPSTIDDAVELANAGALADTLRITVRQAEGDRFPTIVGYEIGDVPEWKNDDEQAAGAFAGTGSWWGDDVSDDVPF
jgi:DNA repair protein RadD